jgi:hypothetical protein
MIDQKRIVICTPQSGVVHTQYYFSNYSVDWEKDNLELPEHIVKPAFNPDPLFKIARGLEGIKKVMLDREERMDSDNDNILTVEEFTKFMLKSGVVPIISKY